MLSKPWSAPSMSSPTQLHAYLGTYVGYLGFFGSGGLTAEKVYKLYAESFCGREHPHPAGGQGNDPGCARGSQRSPSLGAR